MGKAITTASQLTCPHGGTVTITAANPASAGASIATAADTFAIAGCAFTTPAGTPSPCATVAWTSSDKHVTIDGKPTISTDSQGVCIGPSGTQGAVLFGQTQPAVTTS
jgi:hypothetical protein|nr:hypothetical protein [Kofleriaceae bacterium]